MGERHITGRCISHKQYEWGRNQRLRPHQIQDGEWFNLRIELEDTKDKEAPYDWETQVVLRRSDQNPNTIVTPFLAHIDFFDEDLQNVSIMDVVIEGGRGPRADRDSMLRIVGGQCLAIVDTNFCGNTGYLMRDSGLTVPDDIAKESILQPTEQQIAELV